MHNISSVDSRVTVDGTEANNRTMVQCVALPVNVSLPAALILAQERVQIYFHGEKHCSVFSGHRCNQFR